MEMRLQHQNTAAEEMLTARHDGSLTPERYEELIKKGLIELDAFIASIPERDRWIRYDLEADLRVFDPRL